MTKITILSRIDDATIEQLKSENDVVCEFDPSQESIIKLVGDCEILIFRSGIQIDAEILESARCLSLIIRAGSGTDNIDLASTRSLGIRVVTIPEPGATAVAEMSFALMLALARNLHVADDLLRKGRWAKNELAGHGFVGKTLGIVGAGNIGTVVGRMGAAWGMRVLGCVEKSSEDERLRLAASDIEMAELDEVLCSADYVSLHVPLNKATRGLIDAQALGLMKPDSFLVNLSRGGVVDENALKAALTAGRLAGAALDVHAKEGVDFESPLSNLPNVILTPHIGASTRSAQKQIGKRVLELVSEHIMDQSKEHRRRTAT